MENNTRNVIAELRKHASVPGKERTWISALSDEQLYQVYVMLRNQRTGQYIAKHVQSAWNLHPTKTPHSLSQGISKFKKRIAHLLIVPVEEGNPNKLGLDPTLHYGPYQKKSESLEALADQLEDRIRKMMEEESKTGVHLDLNKDVNALSSLRKVILKQRAWEMEHGYDDPDMIRTKKMKEAHMKEQFGRLIDSLPDNGARVVEAGERLFQLLEEHSIPAQYDEKTGQYILNE